MEGKTNCGLANLRAAQVASLLQPGRPGADESVTKALTAFKRAKKLSRTQGASEIRQRQAVEILHTLTELCSAPSNASPPSAELAVDVHRWDDDPDRDWSWLPNAGAGPLNRSAHISLRGSNHLNSCPELFGSSTLPLRIDTPK